MCIHGLSKSHAPETLQNWAEKVLLYMCRYQSVFSLRQNTVETRRDTRRPFELPLFFVRALVICGANYTQHAHYMDGCFSVQTLNLDAAPHRRCAPFGIRSKIRPWPHDPMKAWSPRTYFFQTPSGVTQETVNRKGQARICDSASNKLGQCWPEYELSWVSTREAFEPGLWSFHSFDLQPFIVLPLAYIWDTLPLVLHFTTLLDCFLCCIDQ